MFGKSALKQFTVHFKAGAREETLFVKEGFSLLAFLLGPFWLLFHRAWAPAAFTFALAVAFKYLEITGHIDPLQLSLLSLLLQVWIGFEARDWQREALEARGYALMDVVMEQSEERAELRYYERHMMIAGAVAQATPAPDTAESAG